MDSQSDSVFDNLAACMEAVVNRLKQCWLKSNSSKMAGGWGGEDTGQRCQLLVLEGTPLMSASTIKSQG